MYSVVGRRCRDLAVISASDDSKPHRRPAPNGFTNNILLQPPAIDEQQRHENNITWNIYPLQELDNKEDITIQEPVKDVLVI